MSALLGNGGFVPSFSPRPPESELIVQLPEMKFKNVSGAGTIGLGPGEKCGVSLVLFVEPGELIQEVRVVPIPMPRLVRGQRVPASHDTDREIGFLCPKTSNFTMLFDVSKSRRIT